MELNDRSDTLSLLATRRSGRPRDMVAPGPDDAELRAMLAIATRVPDHGKLSPWRFVIVPAGARERLGSLIEREYLAERPEAGRLEVQALRDFAAQAPALVVALSTPRHESHIPVWEQELSCGVACYNMLLAGHAMGYVGGWLTGWAAYSPAVYAALGGPDGGRVAGFLFFGSAAKPLEERARPALEDVVSVWEPGGRIAG